MQSSLESTAAPSERQVIRRWVSDTWPTGQQKATTELYCFRGQLRETIRFYSESGVYYNWLDRPAKGGAQ